MGQVDYLKWLKPFDQMVFLCHFRPDKIRSSLRGFVGATLGGEFLDDGEAMDVARAHAESVAATPLIFILGQQVDPLKYIFRFAEETGFTGSKLKMVTLGSGQEEKARELIKDFCQVMIHFLSGNLRTAFSNLVFRFARF